MLDNIDEEELLIFLLTEVEPLDQDRGHLGIGGFGKPEAENRLRGFQDEGLIKRRPKVGSVVK